MSEAQCELAEEKSRIAKVKVINPKNPWFGTNGGIRPACG